MVSNRQNTSSSAKSGIGALLQTTVRRSTSPAFFRSFALILVAEAVTILVGWRLLDVNTNRWLQQKAIQAVHIAQQAAARGDWSGIDQVRTGQASALFKSYQNRLGALDQRYFSRKEGGIWLAFVKGRKEYQVASEDPTPLDDMGEANRWEIEAYAQRKATYSPIPIVDDQGTYLAGYVPITKDGHVIGLMAVEYDEAPMSDFQAVIRSTFWLSVAPAVLIALVIAFVLASMFVQPMVIFRRIHETARKQSSLEAIPAEDPLEQLSAREKQVCDLAGMGLTSKEIADKLVVGEETVKTHLKHIREKTGLNKVDLAIHAEARRILLARASPTTA